MYHAGMESAFGQWHRRQFYESGADRRILTDVDVLNCAFSRVVEIKSSGVVEDYARHSYHVLEQFAQRIGFSLHVSKFRVDYDHHTEDWLWIIAMDYGKHVRVFSTDLNWSEKRQAFVSHNDAAWSCIARVCREARVPYRRFAVNRDGTPTEAGRRWILARPKDRYSPLLNDIDDQE